MKKMSRRKFAGTSATAALGLGALSSFSSPNYLNMKASKEIKIVKS